MSNQTEREKLPRLSPCPFCGGDVDAETMLTKTTVFRVACKSPACSIKPATAWFLKPEGPIKAWETRAALDGGAVSQDVELAILRRQLAEREAVLGKAKTLINEQAEDDGLWFVAETITEAHLQTALRKLSAVIEETDDFGIPLKKEPKS